MSIVVSTITNTSIVLATDSLQINGKSLTTSGTVPKIVEANGYYFSLTGITENKSKSYLANKIVHDILLKGDFNEIKEELKSNITNSIKEQIAFIQASEPQTLDNVLKLSRSFLTILIIDVFDEIPTAYILEFIINDINSIEIMCNEHVQTCPQGKNVEICAIGQTGAIPIYLKKGYPRNILPEVLAENLILEQIKLTPAFVGPPIDIIKIQKSGDVWEDVWIKQQYGCPLEY